MTGKPEVNGYKRITSCLPTIRELAQLTCRKGVYSEVLIHKQAWDLSPGWPISTNITRQAAGRSRTGND
jgi:hypothetical protein